MVRDHAKYDIDRKCHHRSRERNFVEIARGLELLANAIDECVTSQNPTVHSPAASRDRLLCADPSPIASSYHDSRRAYEAGARPAIANVPEPSTATLVLLAISAIGI